MDLQDHSERQPLTGNAPARRELPRGKFLTATVFVAFVFGLMGLILWIVISTAGNVGCNTLNEALCQQYTYPVGLRADSFRMIASDTDTGTLVFRSNVPIIEQTGAFDVDRVISLVEERANITMNKDSSQIVLFSALDTSMNNPERCEAAQLNCLRPRNDTLVVDTNLLSLEEPTLNPYDLSEGEKNSYLGKMSSGRAVENVKRIATSVKEVLDPSISRFVIVNDHDGKDVVAQIVGAYSMEILGKTLQSVWTEFMKSGVSKMSAVNALMFYCLYLKENQKDSKCFNIYKEYPDYDFVDDLPKPEVTTTTTASPSTTSSTPATTTSSSTATPTSSSTSTTSSTSATSTTSESTTTTTSDPSDVTTSSTSVSPTSSASVTESNDVDTDAASE